MARTSKRKPWEKAMDWNRVKGLTGKPYLETSEIGADVYQVLEGAVSNIYDAANTTSLMDLIQQIDLSIVKLTEVRERMVLESRH